MAHSLRSVRTGRPSLRRKTSWTVGSASGTGGTSIQLTGDSRSLGGIGVTPSLPALTVVRTRGEFMAYLEVTAGAGEGFRGAFGIAIANTSAFSAGAGSVHMPIDEEDWDGWFYHTYFSLLSPAAVTAAGTSKEWSGIAGVSSALRHVVDSKAMRKIQVGEVVYAAVQVVEIGTSVMRWNFNSRTLLKLP